MPWYAIRSVYLFGTKSTGTNVFEERVVCFHGESADGAHVRAEFEAKEYARVNGFELYPEQSGYEQDGTALVDGYELWSELFEADLSLEDFYAARYTKFLYSPELPE
jgi:hypothetical protein